MLKKRKSVPRLLLMWMMIYSSVLVGSGRMEGAVICVDDDGVALETAKDGLCNHSPVASAFVAGFHRNQCLDIPIFISASGVSSSGGRLELKHQDTDGLTPSPLSGQKKQSVPSFLDSRRPAKNSGEVPASLRCAVLLI